jgi:hypothetical protein
MFVQISQKREREGKRNAWCIPDKEINRKVNSKKKKNNPKQNANYNTQRSDHEEKKKPHRCVFPPKRYKYKGNCRSSPINTLSSLSSPLPPDMGTLVERCLDQHQQTFCRFTTRLLRQLLDDRLRASRSMRSASMSLRCSFCTVRLIRSPDSIDVKDSTCRSSSRRIRFSSCSSSVSLRISH